MKTDETTQSKYTADYFIKKFKAIPEKRWCEEVYTDPENKRTHCALGHCGITVDKETDEGQALRGLLGPVGCVTLINDGFWPMDAPMGKNPRERILGALRAIRDGKVEEYLGGGE